MKMIPNAISRKVARQLLVANKNAPTLLFVGGVACAIGSTVLACRATLKLHDSIDKTQHDVNMAKDVAEKSTEYQEYLKKDLYLIYGKGLGDIAKLYAPAVILGGASIAMLTKSHNLLQQRVAAASAAYAAISEAFDVYRARVVEKYGPDEDRELRYGAEIGEIWDGEKGKMVTGVRVADGEPSGYARFFDQTSPSWSIDPEYNLIFLRAQQQYVNDLLKARGHVFLNEVYDGLGIERSKAGQIVGWVVGDEGDNYIDFGIYDGTRDRVRDFVNGREGAILLDFNVDGMVWDKIDPRNRGPVQWQS